jgi:hypothetical protein
VDFVDDLSEFKACVLVDLLPAGLRFFLQLEKEESIMAKKTKEIEVTVAEVVDYLRITGRFTPALREVVERKVTADTAKAKGFKVTRPQLQKAADAFRVANNLNKASDTENWLKALGVTVEHLEDYLETNLLMSKLKDDLEKKAGKTKYMSTPLVKETVRNMIYQDWLNKQLG